MPRKPLDRETIVAAALAVADEEGLEGLSMRTVAKRLGVQAMSLYHHVPHKAALIDGMHERLLLQLRLELDGLGWEDALREVARSMRDLAHAHPQTFILLATRPLSTPAEIEHVLPVAAALGAGGFRPREQLLAANLFFTSVGGLLLAEVSPVPGHRDVPEPSTEDVIAGSPAAAMVLAASTAGQDYFESNYDTCVDILLAGLRSLPRDGLENDPAREVD